MSKGFQALIDSDVFVAWVRPDDLFHPIVRKILGRLLEAETHLATTSLVILETATVLSNREGQTTARQFLEEIEGMNLPVIQIVGGLYQATVDLFKAQTGRGISMVDCGNVVVARQMSIPRIFSFDKFYTRLDLETIKA